MVDRAAGPFGSRLLGAAEESAPTLRIRVQTLLTTLLLVTNVVGAGVVVGLLAFVIPGPGPSAHTETLIAIAAPGYVLAGLVLGGWWGTRRSLRVLRWALAGRAPSAAERARSLRVPRDLTVVQASLWAGGTVLFAAIVATTQPDLLFTVPPTIGFAGIVVCAHAYLLGEFALRPVAARALAEHGEDGEDGAAARLMSGVGARMLVFWCLGTGVPTAGLICVAGLVLARGGVPADRLAFTVIGLGGVVLVFGWLVTVFTLRAIVAPLVSVRDALAQVRNGDLDVEVAVYDGTELGLLQSGFNRMVRGLRERERIRDLFGRHVGAEVAAAALRSPGEAGELGGAVREVSVLFVDLVGSTELAASRPPTEVVELLNRFFAVVVEEIDARGGLVNKFVGDAVLAVFGAPNLVPDHAERALATARAIARRLPQRVPDATAGIGVATGRVVAGNVGDRRRFEYTVIGDPVNEAARLTELAKQTDSRVVASMSAVASAGQTEAARWVAGDSVVLRGRAEPTTLAMPRSADVADDVIVGPRKS